MNRVAVLVSVGYVVPPASAIGDVAAWGIVTAIVVAACVTTALVSTRAYESIKKRGWPELATALAAFAVGWLVFSFGWLWIDIWWLCRAAGRGVKAAWASVR